MNKYEARIFIKGVNGCITTLSEATLLIEASDPYNAMNKARLLIPKRVDGFKKADVSISIRLSD